MILEVLEDQAGRLEFREYLEDGGRLKVTNDPYADVARARAAKMARTNGSMSLASNECSFPVETIPEDLRERLQRQANYWKTPLGELALDALEVGIDQIEFYEELTATPVQKFSINPSELVARQRAQHDAPIDF